MSNNTNHRKFDPNYALIKDMVSDPYYPNVQVDKVKTIIETFIKFLEEGITDLDAIQDKLDQLCHSINDLMDEFYENDSEIETIARESIASTIDYILEWFNINIDLETALAER
ncbi:hypothetical protein TVAG_193700 [Trichomonas vaginalis G3]|uniref:Uncharacterized protein n=1 Tax=Trichomonas vaginalis (strain ATCC PRA-98 / G3) TaxID=412133 RepID=A2EVM1_TRIV3|nr:Family of unknown function (DUF5713) family [Trichomonas vaginalis G3]EAY03300.1 hypothetical protein TVAG_193700 [Trichomonas vaginalis G3]KAI5531754.1 Family of unknown function (DUF5713) family [Trichomonas vaginalis G3]|eukprot:XP_001315523.1 hypothetical protein [Trichomonas vaginalis G3]